MTSETIFYSSLDGGKSHMMREWKAKYKTLIIYRKHNTDFKPKQIVHKHHILPKSLYPEHKNDKNNLVRFTLKEHCVAHYYLWRYYKAKYSDSHHVVEYMYNALKTLMRQSINTVNIKTKKFTKLVSDIEAKINPQKSVMKNNTTRNV